MVTAGADGQVKVWDARKFQATHAYFSHAPAECLDISQRGLLAVGYGRNVQVWLLLPCLCQSSRRWFSCSEAKPCMPACV